MFFIKDKTVEPRKEPLSEEEKSKWCNKAYIDHLERHNVGFQVPHKNHDSLFSAA